MKSAVVRGVFQTAEFKWVCYSFELGRHHCTCVEVFALPVTHEPTPPLPIAIRKSTLMAQRTQRIVRWHENMFIQVAHRFCRFLRWPLEGRPDGDHGPGKSLDVSTKTRLHLTSLLNIPSPNAATLPQTNAGRGQRRQILQEKRPW